MADPKPIEKQIDDLSALARAAWLSLLGVLAFMAVTLLSITHADVLLNSRKIELPIVQIEVPTRLFLYLAPIVVTVLFVNLHMYLARLWQAFNEAPTDLELKSQVLTARAVAARAKAVEARTNADAGKATEDDKAAALAAETRAAEAAAVAERAVADAAPGAPHHKGQRSEIRFADCIQPWFVNDYALHLKKGCHLRDSGRTLPRILMTLFTAWWAAPIVLVWAWYVSLLARSTGLSLVILACLAVTAAVGSHSWLVAQRRLKGRRESLLLEPANWLFAAICFAALVFSLTATGKAPAVSFKTALLDFPPQVNLERQNLVASVDGVDSVDGVKAQREAFRQEWCEIKGVAARVCANLPGTTPAGTNILIMQRRTYCEKELGRQGVSGARHCTRFFDQLDAAFDGDWAEVRRETLAHLPRIDLSGRDLAGAKAQLVNLTGARLDATDLSGASLEKSVLEGAQFIDADLSDVTAYYADLRLANLTTANLSRANLESSELEGAIFYGAILKDARLADANLVAADLRDADLRGADLRGAQLYRARLYGALMAGADLRGAVGLTQPQLDAVIADATTQFSPPRRLVEKSESRSRSPSPPGPAGSVPRARRTSCSQTAICRRCRSPRSRAPPAPAPTPGSRPASPSPTRAPAPCATPPPPPAGPSCSPTRSSTTGSQEIPQRKLAAGHRPPAPPRRVTLPGRVLIKARSGRLGPRKPLSPVAPVL